MIEENLDIESGGKLGIAEFLAKIPDLHQIDHEQEHMCDVKLPGSLDDPRDRHHRAALSHHSRVHECHGIPRNEHKHIGPVAEAVTSRP